MVKWATSQVPRLDVTYSTMDKAGSSKDRKQEQATSITFLVLPLGVKGLPISDKILSRRRPAMVFRSVMAQNNAILERGGAQLGLPGVGGGLALAVGVLDVAGLGGVWLDGQVGEDVGELGRGERDGGGRVAGEEADPQA
ncbi:uncharacterized protein M6B38_119070 [Iris pallida]|uniref:Uncharacterized protein n=1 Tax=Iris pallida TaxID=29817 RepID=A0AAX6HJU9_IRIPA|nr:uncharacterized protein M6B38_119070 [Iris pallida]